MVTPDQISTFFNIYRHKSPLLSNDSILGLYQQLGWVTSVVLLNVTFFEAVALRKDVAAETSQASICECHNNATGAVH